MVEGFQNRPSGGQWCSPPGQAQWPEYPMPCGLKACFLIAPFIVSESQRWLTFPQKSIMMRSMRTTININDALLQELKERAHREKRPMTKVLEDALRRGLSGGKDKRPSTRIQTHPVGIKPAYRGMSMNQLYDQLESEEQLKVAEK